MDPRSSTSESPTLASVPPCLDLAARTSVRPHADGAKIARIWSRHATLKAQWNNMGPVNSLPNELFVEIFLLAEPIGNCGSTMLPDTVSWAPLMLVCRHWRDVILSTPRLWRVVTVGKGLHWMELAVCRSQHATLDISFWWNSPVLAALNILLPVAERIAAVRFAGMDERQLAAALDLVDVAHSHLTKLCLTRAFDERGGDAPWRSAFPNIPLHSVSFDRQRFPAMMTLAIEGISMVLRDPQAFFSQLCVLRVERCVLLCDPPIFTLSTFLDMLASCPTLEEVYLTKILSQFYHDLGPQNQPRRATYQSRIRIVSIPKLRKFILQDEAVVVSSFMSSLYVPLNVFVWLKNEVDSLSQDSPALFLPLLPHNPRQTLPVLVNVRVLNIMFDIRCNVFELVASSEGGRLYLSLTVERERRTGLPLSRTLDEIIQDVVLEEAEWTRLFAAFRAVENLTVWGLCFDVLKVFAALAQSQPDEDGGSVTTVCPRLRTLYVHGPFWCRATRECILGCLATRAHGGTTSLEKLHLEPSFSLYKKFEKAKEEFLSDIGAVFGGEVEFGYDLIEELDTGRNPSDFAHSDDTEDEDDSDDSDDNGDNGGNGNNGDDDDNND